MYPIDHMDSKVVNLLEQKVLTICDDVNPNKTLSIFNFVSDLISEQSIIKILTKIFDHCPKTTSILLSDKKLTKTGFRCIIPMMFKDNVQLFRFLLNHEKLGSGIINDPVNQDTFFEMVCFHRCFEIFKIMMDDRMCTAELIEKRNIYGNNVLCYSSNKFIECMLNSDKCTYNAVNNKNLEEMSPLMIACKNADMHIVLNFLENDKCTSDTLNMRDKRGNTALHYASMLKMNNHILYHLINSNKCTEETINVINDDHQTILMVLAKNQNNQNFTILLNHPKCTDRTLRICDNNGKTALMYAAERNVIKEKGENYIELFLQSSKCSSDYLAMRDNNGLTALMYACVNKSDEQFDNFLNSDKCTREILEIKDNKGRTALMHVALYTSKYESNIHNNRLTRFLSLHKCTPEYYAIQDNDGNTFLMYCSYNTRLLRHILTFDAIVGCVKVKNNDNLSIEDYLPKRYIDDDGDVYRNEIQISNKKQKLRK